MNIAEAVAREIRRVAKLQTDWQRDADADPMVAQAFAPGLLLMEHTLEHACIALGTGEVMDVMLAHEMLQAFTDS